MRKKGEQEDTRKSKKDRGEQKGGKVSLKEKRQSSAPFWSFPGEKNKNNQRFLREKWSA